MTDKTYVLRLDFEPNRFLSDDYTVLIGEVFERTDTEDELTRPWHDPVCNLRFRAQANNDSPETGFYGQEFTYQAQSSFGVTLQNAEDAVKTLRKLERGMQRINDEDGYPRSVGQFVQRACKVMGIHALAMRAPNGQTMWVEGYKYRYYTRGEIAHRVDYVISDWKSKHEQRAA